MLYLKYMSYVPRRNAGKEKDGWPETTEQRPKEGEGRRLQREWLVLTYCPLSLRRWAFEALPKIHTCSKDDHLPFNSGPFPCEYITWPPETLAHFITNLNLRDNDFKLQILNMQRWKLRVYESRRNGTIQTREPFWCLFPGWPGSQANSTEDWLVRQCRRLRARTPEPELLGRRNR